MSPLACACIQCRNGSSGRGCRRIALYSFLVEHFDRMLEKDGLMEHYIKGDHPEGRVFYAMLDYHKMREFREELLRRYEDQFYAIVLKKDLIIPSLLARQCYL